MKADSRRFPSIPAVLVLLALILGCPRGPDFSGSYRQEGAENPAQAAVLTLKQDNTGVLAHEGVEAQFTWESRGEGTLWLHTKEGGVVAGIFRNDRIEISLPGAGRLVFLKTGG